MIDRIFTAPECMEYLTKLNPHFYRLMLGDEVYGYLALNPNIRICSIHFQVVGVFTPDVLREMDKDFEDVKRIVKSLGCSNIQAAYRNYGDERMFRLLQRYGFSEPVTLAVSSLEV